MRGSLPLLFGVAGVYLVVALGIGLWISTLVETQQQAMFVTFFIIMVYLLGNVIVATRYGSGPSTLSAFLSVLAFDFFRVPPYFTFHVSDGEYLIGANQDAVFARLCTAMGRPEREQAPERVSAEGRP